MKTILRFLLFIAVTSSASNLMAAEGFVCAPEHTTGFSYNKQEKAWKPTIFKSESHLVISRPNEIEKNTGVWVVKKIGSIMPNYFCKEEINDAGYLRCAGGGEFIFNRKNLRFMSTYAVGYVNDRLGKKNPFLGDEGDNTPSISIGQCTPFNG